MAGKPFDATFKDMIDADGPAWSAILSPLPLARVAFVDADTSSVSAAADKVLLVEDATGQWLLDIEPQSSHAGESPDALLLYATLLEHRHKIRVRSLLLLLRPEANATNATGVLERRHPGEADPYLAFRYAVVRLWEEPLERFLRGGLGTLPLAALTDEARADLPGVVERIDARLRQEASPAFAERLRAATYLLLGLRFEEEDIIKAFARIPTMIEESTTYQGILRRGRNEGLLEGQIQEAKQTLLRQGATKFNQPADEATVSQIEGISDLKRLQTLLDRILLASSWDDLLANP